MTQKVAIILVLVLLIGSYFGFLALVGWFDWKERQKRGEPPRFDERQRLVRLRAGNRALVVLAVYLVAWAAADWMELFAWTGNVWSMVLSGLLLAWGVGASDCILHDGFAGWKERNASNLYAVTMTVCCLNLVRPDMTGSWLPFALACGDILVLGGVVLYKHRLEKAGEGDE